MILPISNVINVSVAQAGLGLGEYNTSNMALFTREAHAPSFGLLGYKIYLDPSEVELDFGTSSNTYQMAVGIFSQRPNILANSGYLVVIPFLSSETMAAAVTRSQGLVQYFGCMAVEISTQGDMLAAASVIQTVNKIAAWPSQNPADVAPAGRLDLLRSGALSQNRGLFYGSAAIIAIQNISLSSVPASGNFVLNYGANATASIAWNASAGTIQSDLQALPGLSSVTVSGSLASQNLQVTFTGVDGAASVLTVSSNTVADSTPSPIVFNITTAREGLSIAAATSQCLVMAASYMGRGLSTDFDGSNTTQVMHLKDLIGVQPDPSMTETLLQQCVAAGADTYVSIQGVSKVFTSGANTFWDRVYNLLWIVGALQIAAFNILAQTSTKLPQTEEGMTAFKKPLRDVCEQGVTNQYLAPGVWTSPNTFGNLNDLTQNVAQRGYYIYSQPVSQQSAAARAARVAPLVQIALKEAGAVQSANIIVNVNP